MLARITPALAALTLLAPLALAQKRPDAKALDSRTDAILRFMDADNDGRIAWQEAWNKHNEHRSAVRSAERAEALGDDEKDFPGLTRAKVAAAYANLLEPLDALLADSNRNLSVDRGELRAFLARNAVGEAGKPQRWHYEQLCAAQVRRDWELWLRRLDRDNDGRFSRTEMDDHYLVDVSDKVFRAADADKDNHLTQAEFITLHVEHRLAGVTVEVSDAEDSVGVNGDAQSSAGEKPADGAEPEKQPAPDDAGNPRKTEATRPVARGDMRFKVGSSWVIRRQSSFAAGEVVRWGVGNSATGFQEFEAVSDGYAYDRHEVTRWTDKQGDVSHTRGYFEASCKGPACGSGGGTLNGRLFGKPGTIEITVPAGKFLCVVEDCNITPPHVHGSTREEHDAKRRRLTITRAWYTWIDGWKVMVKGVNADGELVAELYTVTP